MFRRIYGELADAYKALDAASARGKRRVLAQHLREVIDTLEQKVRDVTCRVPLPLSCGRWAVGGGRSGERLTDDGFRRSRSPRCMDY